MGRLNNKDFKRYKELSAKKDLTPAEKDELNALQEKKDSKDLERGGKGTFKPGNDFSWWNKVPVLTKDAVNLPLNWIPGTALVEGAATESGKPGSPASVLKITMQNTYGIGDAASDPLNLTARNLFLAMHRKYRGLNAYQAADVAIVLVATIELFILIARCERAYGTINYYAIDNRTLPYATLRSIGINSTLADNIRDNLSDFRYAINNLIRRAQNVCIPKDLSVLANKLALYGYFYKDHDGAKGQTITFDTNETGIYVGHLADTGGGVKFINTAFEDCNSYEDIIAYLRSAVEALVEDSDVLKIYSDFLSYLDPSAFLTLLPLPEEYFVVPVYSEEILHKIHNLYSTGQVYEVIDDESQYGIEDSTGRVIEMVPNDVTLADGITAGNDRVIVQHENKVCTKLCFRSENSGGSWTSFTTGRFKGYSGWKFDRNEVVPAFQLQGHKQVFDTYRHEAEPSIMLEGCLFKFIPSFYDGVCQIQSCAWEIVTGMSFLTFVDGELEFGDDLFQFSYRSGYTDNMSAAGIATLIEKDVRSAAILTQFDWSPIIYHVSDDDVGEVYMKAEYPFTGDIDNCRMVGYTDIYRMHEVAVYSGLETTASVVKDS